MAKQPLISNGQSEKSARLILSKQNDHPLLSIRRARKMYSNVREELYWIAAVIYGYYAIAIDDDEERQEFFSEPFWSDLENTPNIKNLMSHIFMYVYGSRKGTTGKRAGAHGRALRRLRDQNPAMLPDDLPAYLAKNGGFDGLQDRDEGDDGNEAVVENGPKPFGPNSKDAIPLASEKGQARNEGRVARGTNGKGGGMLDDEASPVAVAENIMPPRLKTTKSLVRGGNAGASEHKLKPIPRVNIFEQILFEVDDAKREILFAMKIGSTRLPVIITRLPDSETYTAFASNAEPLKRFCIEEI